MAGIASFEQNSISTEPSGVTRLLIVKPITWVAFALATEVDILSNRLLTYGNATAGAGLSNVTPLDRTQRVTANTTWVLVTKAFCT